MTVQDLEDQLATPVPTGREVVDVLVEAKADPLAEDLLVAFRGSPLTLYFSQFMPLSERPPPRRTPWDYGLVAAESLVAVAERLEGVYPLIRSDALRCRVGHLIWWNLPSARSRILADCLETSIRVAQSGRDLNDRFESAWSGCDLASVSKNKEAVLALRVAALAAGYQMVRAQYTSEIEADFQFKSGLMFLYGICTDWIPLPVVREIGVICEMADEATRRLLSSDWTRTSATWIHRLRYLAARSDEERVRVVAESVAERRRSTFSSSFLHSELSGAIEDAAIEAARLGGDKVLRAKMEQLTRTLVVELQAAERPTIIPRVSLVSPEDVSPDARDAESAWSKELAEVPFDLAARIQWLSHHRSPLDTPPGLEESARAHRRNVGRFRALIGPYGFAAPDTLRSRDLDELAYSEMSRHRLDVWGQTVARALTDATAPTGGDEPGSSVFSSQLLGPEICERFNHGLGFFLSHDYDSCAHVILPRIEAAIRKVAVAQQIPALQIAYPRLGKISYLDALLRELERTARPGTGPHWKYLRLLLVDSHCGSIRNVLSHGLRTDTGQIEVASRQEAALLLHAAMFLCALDDHGGLASVPTPPNTDAAPIPLKPWSVS